MNEDEPQPEPEPEPEPEPSEGVTSDFVTPRPPTPKES
jgi:hypothetical protein